MSHGKRACHHLGQFLLVLGLLLHLETQTLITVVEI